MVRTTMSMVAVGAALLIAILLATPRPAAAIDDPVGDMVPVSEPVSGNTIGTPTGPPQAGRGDITDVSVQLVPGGLLVCVTRLSDVVTTSTAILWFFGTPGATLIQGFWENHNGVVSSRAASQMGTVPATFDVDAAGSFGCITIPTANLDGIQTVFVYSLSRQTPLGQQPPAEGDPRLRDESGYHTVPAQADEPTNTLTPTPTDTPTPTNTPTPTPTPTPPDEDDAGDGETAASDEPDDDGGAGDGTSDDDAGASDDTDDPVTDDESDNNDQGGAAASDDGDEADGPGGDDDPDAAAAGADDETDTDNDGGGATLATDLADDGGIPIGMILLIGLLALAGGGLVFLLYRLRGGDVPVAPAGLAMDAGSAGTLGGGIAGTGPARDTRGDMNEDGVVDARDYDAFRDRTRRTLPDGDIDGDADVDASDIEALHRAAGSQPGDPAGDTPPSGADPRASTPEPETTTGTESAQEDPPLALQLAPSEVPPSLEPEAPPPPRPGIPQPDLGIGDDGIRHVGDQAMIDEPPDASAGRMSGGVFAVEPPTPAPEPGIPRPDLGGDDGIPYVGDQTMAEEPDISVAGPGIPEGSPAGGTAGDAPGAGPVSDDPSRAAPVDPISSPSDFVFEMPYAPSFPVHWPARDRQRTPHEILSEELEHLDRIADGWNHVAADEHRRKFDETMREIGQDSIGVGLTTPDEQQWESWRRLSEIRQQLARDELTTNLEDLERLRTDPEFRAQRRREIEAELKKHPPVQEPHAGAPDAQQEPVPAPSAPAPVEEPTPALAPAAERVGVTPSFTAGEEDEQSREPSFTFHAPIPYGEEWSYEESLRNEYAFIERLGHEPFFFGNPPQWWKDAQQQHYGTTYRERMQPGANTAEERERIERGHEERLDELETLRTDPEAREKRLLEIHDEMQRVGTGEQPTPTDEPILTIRSAVRDEPLTSVTGVDEFFVVVDLPPGEGTPPETITVKLDASSDGDQEELKLEFVGVVEGNWRYASHDRVTVGEVVSYTVNDVIAIGYGDHGTTFRVYETPEKQRLGEVGDALHELQDDLNGAREQINSLATDEGLERAIEQLDKVGEQSRDAIDEMDPTEEERKQALEDMDETIEQGKEELRRLHGDKAARDEVIAEIDRRLEHVRQGLTHVHAADANYDFDAATGLRPLEGLEAHWDVDTALAMRAETELRLALSSPEYSGHGTQSPADRASSSRAATEEAIGLYKADLTGRHTKEIGLAAVMTILDTPFIPLLPGFLTGYGIATGEDYVTGQQIPLTERALNLAIHVVMTAFAVKLVGATGFGGALSGVRIRVAGPGRPGTGGRRTGTGRPGTRRPPPASRGGNRRGSGHTADDGAGDGRSGRSSRPSLDEALPPVDEVLPPKGPAPPLDEALPPVESVPAPRTTPGAGAPETPAARDNRLLDEAFGEPQSTTATPFDAQRTQKIPPAQNTRPPGSTSTQRVPAPTPPASRPPGHTATARVPAPTRGGKQLPKPGDPGTGTSPPIVFKSPPMKTAGNFYRGRNRLDMSAGVSKQQEQFDCWVTSVVDAARAAGRTDITRELVISTAKGVMVNPPIIKDGKIVGYRGLQPAYQPDNGGMWGMGYQPTLKALGADVTYMEIKTPGQFVGLGAYAQRPGHSVIVDIDIVGGGGHATRLLKYQPRGQPRPSGVDPTVDSPNPGNAILADPGPGVAKEVQAVDLFQQATAGWMIRWH